MESLNIRRNIILNSPHIESISGGFLTFDTDLSAPLKEYKVHFSPIQDGTGDPSPENPRPITGKNSVMINATGKNLFDYNSAEILVGHGTVARANGYNNTNITKENNGFTKTYGSNRSSGILVQLGFLKAGTYTFSACFNTVGRNGQQVQLKSSSQFITQDSGYINKATYIVRTLAPERGSAIITITDDGYYAVVCYIATTEAYGVSDIQLEFGSEATSYESFKGASITIPLQQTVYGGYIDLAKGELTEEWGSIASYDGETINEPWMSSMDKYVSGATPTTGAQVVYKLANPITHQLTPENIRTVRGDNNIWSNSNENTDVKYWMH